MQAPCKSTAFLDEKRLSDWLESFRKDSEFVFGMLKGRWRVLQTGIRLEGSHTADSIWMTCCGLHNQLLVVDGLDGEWEGRLGSNDVEDVRRLGPFSIQRMANPQVAEFGSRSHERAAQIGRRLQGEATEVENSDDDSVEIDSPASMRTTEAGATVVDSPSHCEFRRRLVVHFDILHRQHEMSWPKRNI